MPSQKTFVDTVLSQQLAGDDQMLQKMYFRHGPDGWRDPIMAYCHSVFTELQNSSPDLRQVYKNYEEYRARTKASRTEACKWSFVYRDYKIKYDAKPLPPVYYVKIERSNNAIDGVRSRKYGGNSFAYVFGDALVVARTAVKAMTRSCTVIGRRLPRL